MPDTFLTPTELSEMTGKRRSDAQRRELVHLGVPFHARRDGTLVVQRKDIEHRTAPVKPREPKLHL